MAQVATSLQGDSSSERASESVCEGGRASAVALGPLFKGLGKPLLDLLDPVMVLHRINTASTGGKQLGQHGLRLTEGWVLIHSGGEVCCSRSILCQKASACLGS